MNKVVLSRRKALGQQGLVSLMVTMVLMMVISLIVLGFSQMSRREQQQSLDRQLSTQAFLAAETGVNDAREVIKTALQSSLTVPEKTNCDRGISGNPYYNFNPVMSATPEVSYSCLLVSTKLQDLVQVISADGASATMPLMPMSGQISTLHIDWSLEEDPSAASVATCPATLSTAGTGQFPRSTDWQCPYGVLRIDLVPTDVLTRPELVANAKVLFLYPTKVASPVPVQPYATMNGSIGAMACTTAGCSADISGMAPAGSYAMRASAIYKGGKLRIKADDSAGGALQLSGAQAKIDATGRASGVLRRVEARIPLNTTTSNIPFASLISGSSICKRFGVGDNQFRILSDIAGQDMNNPMCKAMTVAPMPPATLPGPVITDPSCSAGNDIVLVLDTSTSMFKSWDTKTRREKLMEVARDFVVNINIGGYNHMAIIGFNRNATMYTANTGNEDTLLRAVDDLRNSTDTHYLSGLNMAKNDGWRLGDVRPAAPKVLVFVSDGKNDDSDSTILSTTTAMKNAGIKIYTVGISMSSSDFVTLQAMATSSSHFANAASEAQLESIMEAIGDGVACRD